MSLIQCPLECAGVGCPQPDFIERNGAFVLTVIGVLTGCVGGMFTFFLKSRCKKIRCCGIECDRQVLELEAEDIEIETSSKPS